MLMELQRTEFPQELDIEEPDRPDWVMKKLKPVHTQICALLAQGMKNTVVASATGVTPQYITMLLSQPLIKEEISRLSDIAGTRLEGMFTKAVDVIGDAMETGTHSEKLKAARLHGELTKRIGKYDLQNNTPGSGEERLHALAERLEYLTKSKLPGVYNENGEVIEDAEIIRERSFS